MTYCPPPPRRSWRDRLVILLGLSIMTAEHFLAFLAVLIIAAAVVLLAVAGGIA